MAEDISKYHNPDAPPGYVPPETTIENDGTEDGFQFKIFHLILDAPGLFDDDEKLSELVIMSDDEDDEVSISKCAEDGGSEKKQQSTSQSDDEPSVLAVAGPSGLQKKSTLQSDKKPVDSTKEVYGPHCASSAPSTKKLSAKKGKSVESEEETCGSKSVSPLLSPKNLTAKKSPPAKAPDKKTFICVDAYSLKVRPPRNQPISSTVKKHRSRSSSSDSERDYACSSSGKRKKTHDRYEESKKRKEGSSSSLYPRKEYNYSSRYQHKRKRSPEIERRSHETSWRKEESNKRRDYGTKRSSEVSGSSSSSLLSESSKDSGSPKQPLVKEEKEEQFLFGSYPCDVCHIQLNTRDTYKSHLKGKRHLRAVKCQEEKTKHFVKYVPPEKLPNRYPRPPPEVIRKIMDDRAFIQNKVEHPKFSPCPGLENVIEIRTIKETSYYCTMCDAPCSNNCILNHLSGSKHRLQCYKLIEPRDYERYKDISRVPDISRKIQRRLREFQDRYGPGKIQVEKDFLKEDKLEAHGEPSISRSRDIPSTSRAPDDEKIYRSYDETTIPDPWEIDFYCKLCDSHMNNQDMWESHIKGKRHITNIRKNPGAVKAVEPRPAVSSDDSLAIEPSKELQPAVYSHLVPIAQESQLGMYPKHCFLVPAAGLQPAAYPHHYLTHIAAPQALVYPHYLAPIESPRPAVYAYSHAVPVEEPQPAVHPHHSYVIDISRSTAEPNIVPPKTNQPKPVTSPPKERDPNCPFLIDRLQFISEPIVGLDFVTEYQNSSRKKETYSCNLCKASLTSLNIVEHVVSQKHRIKYLQAINHYSLDQLMKMNLRENVSYEIVEAVCRDIQRELGEGRPKVIISSEEIHNYFPTVQKRKKKKNRGRKRKSRKEGAEIIQL